ncbi:MAG: NAD(+) synthase, partial [Firmicutes bacterium]|nr:NAD(+) synthase [Bacillota bacterium]
EEELAQALMLGLKDYMKKNGFHDVVLGISGGIDSAVAAALAVCALGADHVHGVLLPSAITSAESMHDGQEVMNNLGISPLTVPIADLYTKFLQELSPLFGDRPLDVTEENLQARIRGMLLMALSNKWGWLVLTTSNKSELAVGYGTLYGDMAGGFAMLKDVWKMDVYRLARWLNRDGEKIPAAILHKAPSAELRPDQKDADTLPPYEQLDKILQAYIERDASIQDIAAQGFDVELVRRLVHLVDHSEYKRRQAPVGITLSLRAFGRDWRRPIAGSSPE